MSTITHFDTRLRDIASPEVKLALAILNQAKNDAEGGDMSALCFLVTHGEELESYILPGDYPSVNRWENSSPSLEFAKRIWVKIQGGEIKANWGIVETEFKSIMTPETEPDPVYPLFVELDRLDSEF
jgi:hypothetical protein